MPSSDKPKKSASRKKVSLKRRVAWIAFDLILCFLAFTVIPVLLYRVVNPPTTPLMWIRWAESGYQNDQPLKIRQWASLNEISTNLIRAVLTAEDQKFFNHGGFDWEAMQAAFKHNFESDNKRGASTISMQTARNVFLWQERTWVRKILEAYFTLLIELLWPKHRILEVYLNVIEWGDGVFGCQSASHDFFNHPPKSISPVESAWMAAVLPNPRAWSIKHPPKRVLDRQAKILKEMYHTHIPSKV